MSFPTHEMRYITALEAVISRCLRDEEIPLVVQWCDNRIPLQEAINFFLYRISDNPSLSRRGIWGK